MEFVLIFLIFCLEKWVGHPDKGYLGVGQLLVCCLNFMYVTKCIMLGLSWKVHNGAICTQWHTWFIINGSLFHVETLPCFKLCQMLPEKYWDFTPEIHPVYLHLPRNNMHQHVHICSHQQGYLLPFLIVCCIAWYFTCNAQLLNSESFSSPLNIVFLSLSNSSPLLGTSTLYSTDY